MTTYRHVGKPVPRIEGLRKVAGETVYTADVQLPGMLHCKLLLSPYAHARIARIDTAKAAALEGVERVVTAADLPEFEARRMSNRAYNLLARAEAVFQGEPVAAVLARDLATAEEALELIEVDYEELPAVLDPIEALSEDAPPARSEMQAPAVTDVEAKETEKPSNIVAQVKFTRGDIEEGFRESDAVIERRWYTPAVHQGYMETHSTVAHYDPASGELTVWTGTQGQFFVRDQLSNILGIPQTKIRVFGLELGGGFGGKVVLTQPLTAALSRIVGLPVKLVFTRADDLTGGNPATPCVVELKTGMKRDGSLTAMKAKLVFDAGAYPGAPAAVGAILIGASYAFPHLEIESFEVLTNRVSVGALRAPGAHNAAFAIESQMDVMAREIGLDPLEVRLQNAVAKGDQTPSKAVYPDIGLKECLEAVRESDIWRSRGEKKEVDGKRRGVGVAVGGWMGGLQPASAQVRLNGDGTFHVVVGANDITGTNTSFAQIAAEELGVPVETVNVITGDTTTAPFGGITGGSKTLFTVGLAVKAAAEDAHQQMLSIAAQRLEADPEDMEIAEGEVRVKGSPDESIPLRRLASITTGFGAPHPPILGRGSIAAHRQAPGFSAQVAEVEVDPETGEVTVLRWTTAQDVGKAVNPLSVEGQMQGATAHAMGIGLWEELLYDENGCLLNPHLLDYKMPTAMDVPKIETLVVEVPSEDGPYGARGVGEPPIVPGAAVVANAVEDAIGVRVTEVPITPERILRAMGKV